MGSKWYTPHSLPYLFTNWNVIRFHFFKQHLAKFYFLTQKCAFSKHQMYDSGNKLLYVKVILRYFEVWIPVLKAYRDYLRHFSYEVGFLYSLCILLLRDINCAEKLSLHPSFLIEFGFKNDAESFSNSKAEGFPKFSDHCSLLRYEA